MKNRAYPAVALALVAGAAAVSAQPTTPPPPPAAGAARPPIGQIPPEGQWVWQETPYGGRYWAFIKAPNLRNYHGFHTPSQ